VQTRVHLQSPVEVVLAVQDNDVDVPTFAQNRLELYVAADPDRVVAGLNEMLSNGLELGAR